MKIVSKYYIKALAIATLLVSKSVFAADDIAVGASVASGKFSNPFGGRINNLQDVIEPIINVIISVGAIVVVFFVIYSGFKMVMAQGDPGKLGESKKMLFWTIIGGIILLGAKVIAEVVKSTVQELSV